MISMAPSVFMISINLSGLVCKDLQFELGPVSGSAPNLDQIAMGFTPDGMAFYYMWHWIMDKLES